MKLPLRKFLPILFAGGVVAAVGYGLVPEPALVDFAELDQGAIRVTVDQDGKTRIRERYVVSTPLGGRLLRIALDPGDPVKAGETLLATIEPRDPELLDTRTIAQAEARVKAAEASLEKMGPILEEMIAGKEYAEAELKRCHDVRRKNAQAVSTSDLESKLLASRTRTALLRSARHNEEISRFELDQARAALIRSRPSAEGVPGGEESPEGRNFSIHSC